MHRIFVAIGISDEMKQKTSEFQERFGRGEKFKGLRWLEPKNLHITLIPPWYEEEKGLEKIKDGLKKINNFCPFEIHFSQITYGPNPKKPRLIWIEGNTPREILELKDILEKDLNKKPEARLFKTHLTIARFREENFYSFPTKRLQEKIAWKEKVNSFLLMESHLARSGADYEVLSELPLIIRAKANSH